MNRRHPRLLDDFNRKVVELELFEFLVDSMKAHAEELRKAGQPRAGAERIRPTPFGTLTEGGTRPQRTETQAPPPEQSRIPAIGERFTAGAQTATERETPRKSLRERLGNQAGIPEAPSRATERSAKPPATDRDRERG